MRFKVRAVLTLLVILGCSARRNDSVLYRVGGLEVRLYATQAALERDIEQEKLLDLKLARAGGITVKGYFDRTGKRIYSLDDTHVLLHELKHYLEPNWQHGLGEEAYGNIIGSLQND